MPADRPVRESKEYRGLTARVTPREKDFLQEMVMVSGVSTLRELLETSLRTTTQGFEARRF